MDPKQRDVFDGRWTYVLDAALMKTRQERCRARNGYNVTARGKETDAARARRVVNEFRVVGLARPQHVPCADWSIATRHIVLSYLAKKTHLTI